MSLKTLLDDLQDFLLEFTEDPFNPHYYQAVSLRERIRMTYEEIMEEMGEPPENRGKGKELTELLMEIGQAQTPAMKARLEQELADQLDEGGNP